MELMRIAAMLASGLVAQETIAPPLPKAPAAQVDGSAKLSPDATVDQVLDALNEVGKGLKDFSADVTLKETDTTLGDTTSQKGIAVYQKKGDGDARMHVVFNTKQQGKKIINSKVEYLLDNDWLTERNYEHKTEVRRQVLRPGQKIDLLKLGEGPFPLPVGQSPESVQKQFTVAKIPADAKNDPPNTVHIQLTPRPETPFARKFKTIDVWVDTQTAMPRRIQTLDINQTTQRTTDLKITALNKGLKEGDFTLEPVGPDWNRHDEPYAE